MNLNPNQITVTVPVTLTIDLTHSDYAAATVEAAEINVQNHLSGHLTAAILDARPGSFVSVSVGVPTLETDEVTRLVRRLGLSTEQVDALVRYLTDKFGVGELPYSLPSYLDAVVFHQENPDIRPHADVQQAQTVLGLR